MNSDVLPDQPGWLSRMVEFYEANPRIGALGPKLLYEDGSIQHDYAVQLAGMVGKVQERRRGSELLPLKQHRQAGGEQQAGGHRPPRAGRGA